ncbi:MAG TPA: hypothetical protein VN673_08845, partial [Clostridia bacterium]|nr:hypothetical protein [Clostridia bacterium]
MPSMLTQSVRSRWFAFAIHASLWAILVLTLLRLGGAMPPYQESTSFTTPDSVPVPVGRLAQLFAATNWPAQPSDTNLLSPFYTRHFVPPPTPAPPPPATTRKVDVVYQGFFKTPDDTLHAMLTISNNFLIANVGHQLVTNTYVAQVA